MSPQTIGLLIGGVLSAVFFGISGVFSKASTQAGISTGLYIIIAGIGVSLVGIVISIVSPDGTVSVRSGMSAAAVGAFWGTGAALVAFSLVKYQVPISKLAPLYNTNTLVAVLISLFVFAEWQQVHVLKLIIGALLIVVGGTLVALA